MLMAKAKLAVRQIMPKKAPTLDGVSIIRKHTLSFLPDQAVTVRNNIQISFQLGAKAAQLKYMADEDAMMA